MSEKSENQALSLLINLTFHIADYLKQTRELNSSSLDLDAAIDASKAFIRKEAAVLFDRLPGDKKLKILQKLFVTEASYSDERTKGNLFNTKEPK